MNTDSIAEVGIDEQQRLYVRPNSAEFPYIYREGLEVHWDVTRRHLHSPAPREWTYVQWFQQIIKAAAQQEYDLRLTPSTVWTNVPDALRREMEGWQSSKSQDASAVEEERQRQARASREWKYRAAQEPNLKVRARELFFQGRYSEVVRIESQIQFPEFLTPAERQLFNLARKRQ